MGATERLLVEYVLTEGAKIESCVAYSQSYFEDESKDHLNWFAGTIYTSLKDQFEWNLRGGSNAHTSHASSSSERPNKPKVSTTGVVQNRRDKSVSSERRIGKPNNEAHPESTYVEDVPAGLF